MSCKIPAKLNGVESNFYNKLLEIYNGDESRATESYSYIRSPEFLDIFGNYSEAIDKAQNPILYKDTEIPESILERLDPETFEPLLIYDTRMNKYYFKDKEGDKIYYPYEAQGLSGIFTNVNEIKEFAKSLAFSHYNENLKLNPDTMEFENVSGISLREHVQAFTETVGASLVSSEDSSLVGLGTGLQESIPYVDEWVREVESIYNTFKVDVAQEETDESEHMESRAEEAEDLIRIESFLKDSKDNVNNNVKLYLSLIQRDKVNMFGLHKFVEFGDIYTTLNKSLVDLVSTVDMNGKPEDLFEEYKEKIKQLGEIKPYFKNLYELLNNEIGTTEVGRAQIVSAFKLGYQQYIGSEAHKDNEGNISYDVKNLSEVSSRRKNLLYQWNFKLRDTLIDSDKNFDSPVKEFTKHSRDFVAAKRSITTIEQFMPYVDTLQADLESIGVTFNSEGKLSARDEQSQEDIQRGLLYFLDGNTLGAATLEEKKDNLFDTYQKVIRGLERFAAKETTNLYADQSVFTQLADAEAFFQEEGSDASIFTVGKTKWAYSLPSYLSEKINSWKKHPELLYHHYMKTEYNKGSFYMKYLLGIEKEDLNSMTFTYWVDNFKDTAIDRINELELFNFNSVQVKGDAANAKDGKSISPLDATIDYTNKVLAFKKKAKVYHKTALAADKSTEYQPHYGNAVSINSAVTRKENDTDVYNFSTQVEEVLFGYFEADYNRMRTAMAERNKHIAEDTREQLIGNYHIGTVNAFSSQLFPSLTPTFKEDKVTGELEFTLPEDPELADLYDVETGTAHLSNLKEHKQIIIKKIIKQLSENVDAVHAQLVEDNVFELDAEGFYANVGLDTKLFNAYKNEELYDNMATKTLTADLVVNSIVSQVEYSKMFTGDTAYYKNMVDYKKRVPASYTDGLYLYITKPEDVNFNAAVTSSIEVPAPYLDKLRKLLGEEKGGPISDYYAGKGINAADAQAWITPQRWRFIKEKLGKWTSKDSIIYDKLFDEDATFSPEELKKLAQPLKGVYFDIVDGVPRYLKYSQGVLVPRLIKGTDLQRLYDKMVKKDANGNIAEYKDQIHEVITKDGFKVGYPTPNTIHDENGDLLQDFTLDEIPLANAGWKLQQDLSPKGFKSTEVGSQIMKVIFQGLEFNLDKTFIVGDVEMTGAELIEHINDLVSNLSDRGIEQLMSKLGINPDTFKIENEEALVASMISDLKKRPDTTDNTIKALLAGTSPYGISGQFQIFQNVFSSAVNKAAVKIRTNGGSFIQMADFGISKTEAYKKERGIRFAPWMKEDQSKLHTPESYIDAEGRKRVRPGGVFISASFIAKYVPDYNKLSDEELFGKYNSSTGKYEKGLIDEKILKNIVGYRIPNQGLPSNDAFHVMGLLPEDSADTIIAYTGITTKTGSDFDIDKMYLMMPTFTPRTNIKSEAFRVLMDNFKGDSIADTIYNLQKVVDTLDLEVDITYLATEMETNEGRKRILNQYKKDLIAIILNPKNANEPLIKEIKSRFDTKVTRLVYEEPFVEDIDGVETELPLHEQPLGVVQNKLIEAYVGVLTSPHAIKDIMKPIDEPFAENDIKNMYPEVKRPDMMDFDAYTDIKLKEEFRLGKAGLGQNVNALVDAVRGGMAQLSLNEAYVGRGNTIESKDEGIETLFDQEYSDELSQDELEEYVDSYNKFAPDNPITIEQLEGLAKIKLADSMKALVNGFVDIAKDPFITRGGWVTQTNNVGFLLVRAGVHPFYINAFLGQPIIKDYVNFVNTNESNAINETDNMKDRFLLRYARKQFLNKFSSTQIEINDKSIHSQVLFDDIVNLEVVSTFQKVMRKRGATYEDAIDAAHTLIEDKLDKAFKLVGENNNPSTTEEREEYNKLRQDLKDAFQEVVAVESLSKPLREKSLGQLRNQILEPDVKQQVSTIHEFFELLELSKSINNSVKGSKADTDGKGKNIGSLIVANNFVRNIIKQEIDEEVGALRGFATKLKQANGKDTFLNRMFKNSILTPYKIMRANPKFFLTAQDSVIYAFNYISHSRYGERLQKQDLADNLEKAHYSYVMSGFAPLQASKEEKLDIINELPDEIARLKDDPFFKDNMFLNTLYIKEGTDRAYIAMPANKKSVSVKNNITDGWRELMLEEPEVAEKLIKYSFYISGFNMSMNQFHEFIPYEWFNRNRFNSYLKTIANSSTDLDRNFIDQFYRNNAESSTTSRVFDWGISAVAPGISTETAIKLQKRNLKDGIAPHFVKYVEEQSIDDIMAGREFIPSINYYKYVGDINDEAVYVRSTPLGSMDKEGNKIVEYDSNVMYSDVNDLESIIHELPANVDKAKIKEISSLEAIEFMPPDHLLVTEEDTKDVTLMLEAKKQADKSLIKMINVDDTSIEEVDSEDPNQDPC